MSDETKFTNREWSLPARRHPKSSPDKEALRIEACVDEAPAAEEEDGAHLEPYITWWDDSPEGGGFYTFSAKRAREIAAALIAAAEHAEAAAVEGERRGWRWWR